VLPEYAHRGSACYLVMPSARLVPTHVALFRDFLLEHLPTFWEQIAVACTERRGVAKGGKPAEGARGFDNWGASLKKREALAKHPAKPKVSARIRGTARTRTASTSRASS
jgi:hypothetical protein